MDIAGTVLIFIGLLICFLGTVCLLFAKNFKQRLLLCSIIDSCGLLTCCAGILLRAGIGELFFKSLLVVGISFIVNPITANKIAYSVFYKNDGEDNVDSV